jgi:hypothetical protein
MSKPSGVSPWDQLAVGIDLPFHPDLVVPELHEVVLDVPNPPSIDDVEGTARAAVLERLATSVEPGMTIAVGGGSRGLTDRVALMRGSIRGLLELGAKPFVVPAMGSHGGATDEGQREMLEDLGMTEDALGAEIRSSMDTVVVARTPSGMPLYLDAHAAGADRIMPVNRIKPHTCFKGPLESGLSKMSVVGFGKQPGAAQVHSCGPIVMRDRIVDGIAALKATGRILGGVGSIESPDGRVVQIKALTGDEIGSQVEIDLTNVARTMVPTLPFGQIDVLIVEQIGKDISGTAMDPNVTGRFWVNGLDVPGLVDVATIVVLGVTEVSGGNVLGIGLGDFIPASVANGIDWHKTYVNCFTAGAAGVRRSRMPMVLPDEQACIKAALSMCGRAVVDPKRVVRIRSTLHLTTAWVSDAVLADLPASVRRVAR